MGITLNFTETIFVFEGNGLFVCRQSILYFFSNLKLNVLLCMNKVNYFGGHSVIFCIAILIFLPSVRIEKPISMFFCSKF